VGGKAAQLPSCANKRCLSAATPPKMPHMTNSNTIRRMFKTSQIDLLL
jgi:hypothetical protein